MDHSFTKNKARSSSSNSNSNCRPPAGKTYLTIGQDLFSIQEYLDEQYKYNANASLHQHSVSSLFRTTTTSSSFAPAAVMVYTDIQSLLGLDQAVDYGSGIEYADGVLDIQTEQRVGLQIGLWLNGTDGCRQIVDGLLNAQMDQLFHYLLHDCQATKIFLRVGYEFDNPSFMYDSNPPLYRQAFRRLVEACEQQQQQRAAEWSCRDKVKFVWHSWGAASGSASQAPLGAFYPGDDVVDWVGVSVFQQVFSNSSLHNVKQVLQFAADHDKPTMIAESTPFGGITSWEDWFQPVLHLIEDYDISMWSYINCDWDGQAMWHNVGFGDTRLSTNEEVMHQWYKHVIEGNRFLGSGSLLNCGMEQVVPMTTSALINASPPNQYSALHPFVVVVFVLFSVLAFLGTWQWRRTLYSSPGGQSLERGVSPIQRSNPPYSYGAVQNNNSAKI